MHKLSAVAIIELAMPWFLRGVFCLFVFLGILKPITVSSTTDLKEHSNLCGMESVRDRMVKMLSSLTLV